MLCACQCPLCPLESQPSKHKCLCASVRRKALRKGCLKRSQVVGTGFKGHLQPDKGKKLLYNKMAYAQMLSSAIETKVYETLHSLLGQIAKDYDLSHGDLVEKYLVQGREGSPPPQFIYAKEVETPAAPKKKSAKVKVTKAESESEEEVKPKRGRKPKAKSESDEEDRTGKCTSLTAKGTPCKNKAFGGGCTCRVHTPKEGEKKETKEKKAPAKRGRKPKAKAPEHSHKMDELAASDCELCETHGNPMKGEQEFEVVDAAQVVAALRAEESDSETEDEKASVVWTEDNLSEEEMAALAAELEEGLEEAREEDLE